MDDKIIYRYLGYKGNVPDKQILDIIKLCKQELENTEHPLYTYKVFDIDIVDNAVNVLGTNLCLTGKSIVRHLKGASKVVLLCATLGNEVDRYIKICKVEDITKALVADAVASVRIDDFCDSIEEELGKIYSDMNFTYRFGLGYGDLPLELEPVFLNVLEAAKKIGVYSNESYILSPGKSVACVIGLIKKGENNEY